MEKNLIENKKAIVKLSDPWDLGEILNWKALSGTITRTKLDEVGTPLSIIIQLDNPFDYKNTRCEYFIASPRHEGTDFSQLGKNQAVFSGLTQISIDQINASDPFDLSKWRGGIGIIGEVELIQ